MLSDEWMINVVLTVLHVIEQVEGSLDDVLQVRRCQIACGCLGGCVHHVTFALGRCRRWRRFVQQKRQTIHLVLSDVSIQFRTESAS